MEFTLEQKSFLRQKCYFLKLVTYLPNFKEIILQNLNKINKYAYCTHDKDDNKIHTHIILSFFSDQTLMKYAKLFNTTEIAPLDRKGLKPMFDYLIHDTPKCRLEGKHLYDVSERFSNDPTYFDPPKHVSPSKNIGDMLDDVLRISRRSFAIKYGFAAMLNYSKILQFSLQCKAEDEAIASGSQIEISGSSYVVNQSSGELVPLERKKFSKFLSKHLTSVD